MTAYDRDELLRWAETYGHPEEWAKKAQSLHAETEKLQVALDFVKAERDVRVPLDDAAVERGAAAVEREIEGRSGGDAYLYEMDDDVRVEFLRAVAECVLRAAGGPSGAVA